MHVVPVAIVRDLEAVRFGKQGQLGIAGFVDDLVVFLVPDVTNPLEEQQRNLAGNLMNRTERFYKIDQMLHERRVVPIEVFLEVLDVSRATFKRDMEYLRDRGR